MSNERRGWLSCKGKGEAGGSLLSDDIRPNERRKRAIGLPWNGRKNRIYNKTRSLTHKKTCQTKSSRKNRVFLVLASHLEDGRSNQVRHNSNGNVLD